MWIRTHYYMAKLIHNYIKEKYQLDLRLDLLQYGSVKPDLHWRYINIPHYYEEGYGYWLEEVRELLVDKKYRDIKEFSEKLGIILHFTADFFCYAHNNKEMKETMWPHLKYELQFHQIFIHYEQFHNTPHLKCEDINSLIKILRQKYLFSKPNMEKDIRYIYSAALSITDLMVAAVLLPSVQAA
ncbi:MAG: hypothetical protein FD167_5456 [bacterium]|nr:MAG: hypothetical protein FD167_5456 [bacterium]